MTEGGAAWDVLLDGEEVAHRSQESARPGRSFPLPEGLAPSVAAALRRRGIDGLWSHQAEAWEALAAASSVVVTTGTASGKSLAFNLPVLDAIAARPARPRALPLPDEGARPGPGPHAGRAARCPGSAPAIYDGDTPTRAAPRTSAAARTSSSPTPTCSTSACCPTTTAGATSSPTSRFVVVDEAHVYRGVFGSHVAERAAAAAPGRARLRRRAALPARLRDDRQPRRARRAADRPRAPADRRATPRRAPSGEIAIWNPPLLDDELGTRASALGRGGATAGRARRARAADDLLREVPQGCGARASLRRRTGVDRTTARRIAPYRAGYTPQQRREIERRLVAGELLGVVATDALELGIDIGELDARSASAFPGTVASLRQMWGRAGRRGPGSRSHRGRGRARPVLLRDPEEFLDRPVEAAILDHDRARILAAAPRSPRRTRARSSRRTRRRSGPRRSSVRGDASTSFGSDARGLGAGRGRDLPAARVSLRSG